MGSSEVNYLYFGGEFGITWCWALGCVGLTKPPVAFVPYRKNEWGAASFCGTKTMTRLKVACHFNPIGSAFYFAKSEQAVMII